MTRGTLDSDTQEFLFDELRMERFRKSLEAGGRRTVGQAMVMKSFTETYSDLPTGRETRIWLLAVLKELADRDILQLPVEHGTRWDRTSEIALPTSITLVADSPDNDARDEWRQFPWHPTLQWVLRLRTLGRDHVSFLKRVNVGLVEGWFAKLECFKYRSLQLTGDEKRLEDLLKGVLFSPGGLTLKLLGCEAEALPIATEYISSEPIMLVFENAAPFMLARNILVGAPRGRIGRLAYGAGKQVLKAVAYLTMIEPPIKEVRYVGDLDSEGLKIAVELQRLSTSVAVRPAIAFHRAMLESAENLGFPNGWPMKDDQPLRVSEAAFAFVAPGLRSRIADIICAGRRIPEEVLPHSTMSNLLKEFE